MNNDELTSYINKQKLKNLFKIFNDEKIIKIFKLEFPYLELEIIKFKDNDGTFYIINFINTDIIFVKKISKKYHTKYRIHYVKKEEKLKIYSLYGWLGEYNVVFSEKEDYSEQLLMKYSNGINKDLDNYLKSDKEITKFSYEEDVNMRYYSPNVGRFYVEIFGENVEITVSIESKNFKLNIKYDINHFYINSFDDKKTKIYIKLLTFLNKINNDIKDITKNQNKKQINEDKFINMKSMITWLKLKKKNIEKDFYFKKVMFDNKDFYN